MESQIAGKWSKFRELTESDKKVFMEAVGRIDLVPMLPQLVAEQVVAGQNYLFVCSSEKADLAVVMAVYVKPNGEMQIKTGDVGDVFRMVSLNNTNSAKK